MDKEILESQLDENVAEALVQKVQEFKERLETEHAKQLEEAKAEYETKISELESKVETIAEEKEEEVREEYSARLIAKISEKNEEIERLQEEKERHLDELTEKVHSFLANSKDEIRTLAEEEIRVSSETLSSQRIVEQIQGLVGQTQPKVETIDESKTARLEDDIAVLKERVENKTVVNRSLKAKLHAYELVESVDSDDREFYLEQLSEATSVEEADGIFEKVTRVLEESKQRLFEEELEESSPSGVIVEDSDSDYQRRNQPYDDKLNESLNRMKILAGLNG